MKMTFRQFTFNNVLRNKRLYIAYFLSSLFTVMTFFTFAIFAFHPEVASTDTQLEAIQGMAVAGGIIYVFSFFFILYSMGSFLQSRKKEFGVLMTQGMSPLQLRWMVFLENMLIGFFAISGGILLGLIFAKMILLIAENILILDGNLNFYFPFWAIVLTFSSFIILFLIISIFVTFILRTNKLVKLLKSDEAGKREPKSSIIYVLLAVLLLGSGYTVALTVKGTSVVLALVPVVILVIIATYLLFTQLSVFVIRKLKENKRLFWRKTNMLLFSDLSFRMKDNARTFFMVTIISTVAFSAIGTLFGFHSFLTNGVIDANPTSFAYTVGDNSDNEVNEITERVDSILKEKDIQFERASIKMTYFNQAGSKKPVLITTDEKYNLYADLIGDTNISDADDEAIPVDESLRNIDEVDVRQERLTSIQLEDGSSIHVNEDRRGEAIPDVLPEVFEYYIISEATFAKLGEPEQTTRIYDWQVVKGDYDDIIETGEVLTEVYKGSFFAVDYTVHLIEKIYSPIMFIGLFIGIIFFV